MQIIYQNTKYYLEIGINVIGSDNNTNTITNFFMGTNNLGLQKNDLVFTTSNFNTPIILSKQPLNNALNVSKDIFIRFIFNENIIIKDTTKIQLFKVGIPNSIPITTVIYNNTQLVIKPINFLESTETYIVQIDSGIIEGQTNFFSGIPLTGDQTYSFTVIDYILPSIDSN